MVAILYLVVATYQELPVPMTVMGEQDNPTRTFRSWTTMPRRPIIVVAAASLAFVVELQHWMGPVVQFAAGMGLVRRTGVAAARATRAVMTKVGLNNMV
jgi:hypothetical protein